MKQLSRIIILGISAWVLVACQPKDIDIDIDSDPATGDGSSSATDSGSSAEVGTLNGNAMETAENMPRMNALGVEVDENGIPVNSVFYFNFDQSSVNGEDLDTLASHGEYIADTPSVRVRIEGHTDERGAREYNVALGENRAKSIERILQLQGVRPTQLSVLSLGEEQPANLGHNEDMWKLNRRVEIIYEIR